MTKIKNSKTEKFLDLYRKLEFDGRRIYFPNSKDTENIMGRLINSPQLSQCKDDLDYCRVVRNFITHNPKVGGVYPISPSDEMIELLEKCLNIVNNPPKAINYAVKADHMLIASLYDTVTDIVQMMNRFLYTHVPVVENNKLLGIFSDNTVYTYMCKENTIQITNNTLIKEFEKYIPIDKHLNEYFEFVNERTMLYEIEDLFHYDISKHKLLAVVYITKNGRPDEPILGMITPWDILSET